MFNSLRRIQKSSILWAVSRKSSMMWINLKLRLNYLIHIERSSNLLVMFKKVSSIFWVCSKKKSNSLRHIEKGFNSLSHIVKCVQYFQLSFLKEKWFNSSSHVQKVSSILWVMLKVRVQFLWVMLKKKGWILWVMLKKKGWILWVKLNRRVLFFESCWTEGFFSLSLIRKKGSIQWMIVFEKFKSWSQNKKKGFNA